METGDKGNKVDVNTFKKWGEDNIHVIGHKTIEGGWNVQYLLLINCMRNLICTSNRLLAPNFKRERLAFLLEFASHVDHRKKKCTAAVYKKHLVRNVKYTDQVEKKRMQTSSQSY